MSKICLYFGVIKIHQILNQFSQTHATAPPRLHRSHSSKNGQRTEQVFIDKKQTATMLYYRSTGRAGSTPLSLSARPNNENGWIYINQGFGIILIDCDGGISLRFL